MKRYAELIGNYKNYQIKNQQDNKLIIDSGYWGPDGAKDEGHIMFQVYNFTDKPVTVLAGERIGQGVFLKYYTTDNDRATGERAGRGFGSTGTGHISSEEEDSNTGDFQND